MSEHTIYRAPFGGRGIDEAVATESGSTPTYALENFAERVLLDRPWSFDEDDLRVWICPRFTPYRFYAYKVRA